MICNKEQETTQFWWKMQKENNTAATENFQYVGPYRLQKTLGKGQTGKQNNAKGGEKTTPLLLRKLKSLSFRFGQVGSSLCPREEGGDKNY